jgi:hypothetical protein
MMHPQKTSARAEYRHQESQRVQESATLSEKFRKLKSLTVDLMYYNPDGVTRSGQIKYKVNLAHAKSVFRFDCPNPECVRGDFDLSKELANAVSARRTTMAGEMSCQGWRNKTTIGTMHCHHILRYKLSLGY